MMTLKTKLEIAEVSKMVANQFMDDIVKYLQDLYPESSLVDIVNVVTAEICQNPKEYFNTTYINDVVRNTSLERLETVYNLMVSDIRTHTLNIYDVVRIDFQNPIISILEYLKAHGIDITSYPDNGFETAIKGFVYTRMQAATSRGESFILPRLDLEEDDVEYIISNDTLLKLLCYTVIIDSNLVNTDELVLSDNVRNLAITSREIMSRLKPRKYYEEFEAVIYMKQCDIAENDSDDIEVMVEDDGYDTGE